MTVFLDANILFSAADPDRSTRRLLEVILARAHVVTNEHAWEEARRNLARKRPRFVGDLDRLRPRIEFTTTFAPVEEGELPAKDQPILGGAVASACSHLGTGDRRPFGARYGRVVSGTRIVSSVLLADELAAAGWLK